MIAQLFEIMRQVRSQRPYRDPFDVWGRRLKLFGLAVLILAATSAMAHP